MIRAALEPVTKYGSQLIGALAQSGHLTMEETTRMAKGIGEVSLRSASLCFKIGLEYSTRV